MKLVEVFKERKTISIIIPDHKRIDLDVDSALDLVETILMLTGEEVV